MAGFLGRELVDELDKVVLGVSVKVHRTQVHQLVLRFVLIDADIALIHILIRRSLLLLYVITMHTYKMTGPDCAVMCVCVCVFFPFILDNNFVGRTSRGHTGERSHRIFHPSSFCGARFNVSGENDSAIPFPRRP